MINEAFNCTDIRGIEFPVSRMALGCWPIAGVTSVHVNDVDSRATLQAALDSGINFFDTAFGYGRNGESEKLIGNVFRSLQTQVAVASKTGMHWCGQGKKVFDSHPKRIQQECDESLRRLGREQIELYYLHQWDGKTPIEDIAEKFLQLKRQGKILAVGVCNLGSDLVERFHAVCPVSVVQDYFNALQMDDRKEVVLWCRNNGAKFVAYWPLMKGLLAGDLQRYHVFHELDSRKGYPMFLGQQWERNQQFLDEVREISRENRVSVAGIVLRWTLSHVDFLLCGAKRPQQVLDNFRDGFSERATSSLPEFELALKERLAIETR